MVQRLEEPFRPSVAFVTHTRDYRSADLLPALARAGYTTTERPHDRETERLLRQFEPELIVLAVDPRQESDLDLVGSIARASEAALLVVAPGPHSLGFATALLAGADVCVRESDGPDMIAAQLASLARRRGNRRERPKPET